VDLRRLDEPFSGASSPGRQPENQEAGFMHQL
jgi:hypothetical protein